MLFDTLRVKEFRSIADSGTLELGPVNLIVGRNNSGKSSLLRAVYFTQNGSPFQKQRYQDRPRPNGSKPNIFKDSPSSLAERFLAKSTQKTSTALGRLSAVGE